jgi:hypothetical protein
VRLDDRRLRENAKRPCPKCKRQKVSSQFKRDDPDGWCRNCRNSHRPPIVAPPEQTEPVAEIKLGPLRLMRVRLVGGMAALTCGRIEERSVRKAFVESATITIPLRVLPEVRAALTRLGRLQRKAERGRPK